MAYIKFWFLGFSRFVIIIFLVQAHYSVFSQVNTQWVARYNSPANGNDYPESIKTDGQGNIYIAGSTQDSAGFYDCTLMKYSPAGVLLWVQRYSASPLNDGFEKVVMDNAGNIYAIGYCFTDSIRKNDIVTVKYDNNGVRLWSALYNGFNFNDYGNSIAVDNNGNVFTGGSSDSAASNGRGFILIKYNSSGVQQWAVRKFGNSTYYNSFTSLFTDSFGNVFAAGTHAITTNNTDYIAVKYNSAGSEQWLARYDQANNADIEKSMTRDSQGNIYLTGLSVNNSGNVNCVTVKFDPNGVYSWVASYNGQANGYDEGVFVIAGNNGNIYVTGRAETLPQNYDILTISYNSTGTLQWIALYNGPVGINDVGRELAVDNNGNVYVTGRIMTDTLYRYDYATIKYDASGIQKWVVSYNGINGLNDFPVGLALDFQNNVVVTGYSQGLNNDDIVTIKYVQTVGITQITNEIPNRFVLYQNYPNPFNPSTVINFDLPQKSFVTLMVYDISGREVLRPVSGELDHGSFKVNIDSDALAAGVYFYRLKAGSFNETKKMVLIK